VVEMVDTRDLKSLGQSRVGSTPAERTKDCETCKYHSIHQLSKDPRVYALDHLCAHPNLIHRYNGNTYKVDAKEMRRREKACGKDGKLHEELKK
jgi:hypothetical protein